MSMEAKLSANRGEWAEVYTMFKLLSDGKLYAADENTSKLSNIFLPILSVLREEIENEVYDYQVGDKIRIFLNSDLLLEVEAKKFTQQAENLFRAIQEGKGSSFKIPETESFMASIYVNKVKQRSTKKSDIMLRVQEINSGIILESGFSIKSNFKAKAHLVNASQATNFIYQVKGFDDEKMATVNKINTGNKIKDRMQYIVENSELVVFESMFGDNANSNLMLIDSKMPEIIGYALHCHYFKNTAACVDVARKLGETDPLFFSNPLMYSYKIKKFLCACALGMNFGKKWDGIEEANGGYIIVKDDGDIVAYHIYNRNIFETFLFNDTKFERGSIGRHKYAEVYKNDNQYQLRLNLAIRFK